MIPACSLRPWQVPALGRMLATALLLQPGMGGGGRGRGPARPGRQPGRGDQPPRHRAGSRHDRASGPGRRSPARHPRPRVRAGPAHPWDYRFTGDRASTARRRHRAPDSTRGHRQAPHRPPGRRSRPAWPGRPPWHSTRRRHAGDGRLTGDRASPARHHRGPRRRPGHRQAGKHAIVNESGNPGGREQIMIFVSPDRQPRGRITPDSARDPAVIPHDHFDVLAEQGPVAGQRNVVPGERVPAAVGPGCRENRSNVKPVQPRPGIGPLVPGARIKGFPTHPAGLISHPGRQFNRQAREDCARLISTGSACRILQPDKFLNISGCPAHGRTQVVLSCSDNSRAQHRIIYSQ